MGLLIGFCEKWWMIAVRGVVALGFGLLVLLWPGLDANVLALAFGVFAVADGLVLAGLALVGRDVLENWWVVLAEGGVGVILGVLALSWNDIGGLSLLALLAAWAVVTGVFEIEAGVRLRRLATGETSLLLAGVLSVAVGITLVALPKDDPVEIAWAIGVFGMAYGALLVLVAGRMRRLALAARPSARR
jgi:uncharacterized membrane protein HdeD (DUF308 family)